MEKLSRRESPVGRERTPTPELLHRKVSYEYDPLPIISPVQRLVLNTCRSCQQRMQTATDLLLGSGEIHPFKTSSALTLNRSLGRCRDTILRFTRNLVAQLRNLASLLGSGMARSKEACLCLEEVCDTVVDLTEACAHTAYIQAIQHADSLPGNVGPIDRYELCRAATSVQRKIGVLKALQLEDLTPALVVNLRNSIAEAVRNVEVNCTTAATHIKDTVVRDQLLLSAQSIAGAAAAFDGIAKELNKGSGTSEVFQCSQSYADAIVAICEALIIYTIDQQALQGSPATLGRMARHQANSLLTAAMAVVSPCILMCNILRDLSKEPHDHYSQAKAQSSLNVVMKGSVRLAGALGVTVIDVT